LDTTQVEARFLTLHEIVAEARRRLAPGDWDYLVGGADTETTLRRNRAAIDSLGLRPRVLNDVSEIHTRRTFLGHDLRLPLLLAPIGSLEAFHADGGLGAARAAQHFGVMQVLSSACRPDFETVGREAQGAKIYQLYVTGDDDWLFDTIRRAIAAGYAGFALTVDTQVYSRRERDIAKRFVPGAGRRTDGADRNGARRAEMMVRPRGDRPLAGMQQQMRLTWALVERIRRTFDIPLVLKGIATAADAARAAAIGVDVVYVSNHGGRQLDQSVGTLDLLPDVVAAVGGRARVVVDGGIYRGTDVVKALALGASAVGVGRLEGFAMAAGGPPAVVRMLEILESEVRIALALLGVASIDDLDASFVVPAQRVREAGVLDAFPLLGEGY
jgi:glycolate oxidase